MSPQGDSLELEFIIDSREMALRWIRKKQMWTTYVAGSKNPETFKKKNSGLDMSRRKNIKEAGGGKRS